MSEVIRIIDGGFGVIEQDKQSINVGQIIFRVSENESTPIDHIAYCKPYYKESIIKNLNHLCFPKDEKSNLPKEDTIAAMTYKLRAESMVDVFYFLEENRKGLKSFFVNSISNHSHVEVTFVTKLAFDEIKQTLETVYDGHLMVDTVQPIEKYTGEIK